MFARHGIPYEVKSDNGPQYISQEFRQFAKDWNFQHTTSSPYHQQANGLAERTVQTVKRLLEKSRVDGSDPYLAILEYRNTPTDTESPAKLLMSRELRSILPVTTRQLRPKTVKPKDIVKDRKEAQRRQQYYFNRSARDQPKISMGQAVRFRHKDEWKPGYVMKNENRSYWMTTPEGEYRRNRKDILISKEKNFNLKPAISIDDEPNSSQESDTAVDSQSAIVSEPQSPRNPTGSYRTRSGREVRKPKRFEE
ncbi:uncharacterized protein K02A2.6-like [Saccostrea cucullata]|uniref:uncharacterized protein K02A2.6-like n=1 Tax=Saccostrea cuccullata TaxID=36930 RepID=UPI002ED29632